MKKIIILFSTVLFLVNLEAQMTITNGFSATQLATTLSGSNVTITSATMTGVPVQYGKFSFAGPGFPISEGVILSNGSIFNAPGPNSSSGMSDGLGQPGNALLTAISGQQTYDAVLFQFDFQVQSDNIEFQYIFASEEYNEFVGSFNDVFGFFISGPGIVGEENIALVPGTTVPVAINNINLGSYWQYYNDNETGTTNIEFDGYTTLLTAQKTGLIPCSTYTLKLIIADAGDEALNSAVFLKANSLVQQNVMVQSNTISANGIALEGCVQASFTFNLDTIYLVNTSIPFQVGGTAIEGIDYQNLDTAIVIPAGQTSATIYIDAIADGLPEGIESIDLIYQDATCGTYDTITLFIDDYQPLEYTTTPNNPSCAGDSDGEILFGVSGGTSPYTFIITDSATNITTNYTTNPVTGLDAGTYLIEVADVYGCQAADIVAGNIFSGAPVFLPDGNGNAYTSTLNISGFGVGQTLTNINQFQSMCMNIEHSRLHELEILLTAPDGTTITLKQQPGGGFTNLGEPQALAPSDAGNADVTPGVGYDYCFTASPTYGTMVGEAGNYTYTYTCVLGNVQTDTYLPSGSYQSFDPLSDLIGVPLNGPWTLTIEDHTAWNNGYLFSWSISLQADMPDSIVVLTNPPSPALTETVVQPTCGNNNGSIDLTVAGGTGPFTYSWSSGPTTQDLNSIGAGNYIVTVTDANSCSITHTVSLSNSSGVTLPGTMITNQTCIGANTGAINITPTGGGLPYTYLWSTGAVTQDISALAPGTYNVQTTDGGNCIAAGTYIVLPADPIIITGSVTNEYCSDQEGAIDINVLGGQPGYTYSWTNGQTTQDITDLAQGNYTVTVTDANTCTQTETFQVTNVVGSCTPVCDLSITSQQVIDETCGQGNGEVNLTFFTSSSPSIINWSNGATTNNITNLSAGNYSVTITDAQGCSLTQSYTVINNTGTLALAGSSITNEACGNGQGNINVTISGGGLPYTFSWSNGATTEDIAGLVAGTYTLTVTDANSCQLEQNFVVGNNSGTLAQTWGNVMDAVCGQSNGSIDITITGGGLPYNYLWSNAATTEDLINVPAGTYSCQITDQSGCIINTPVYTVLNNSGTLAITNINPDNEVCGNGAGEILITMSGGSVPYSYAWSNGPTTQNITSLSAGTYSCIITDNVGCSISTGPVSIINESGTLALNSITAFDEVCSNGNGSVNLEVTGGAIPYQYLWNTMSTSEDLVSLSAGNYSCIITDINGCQINANTNVNNSPGTLSIDNAVVTNENCGDGSGAVNLLMSGGNLPYTFLWSNTAVTEDILGLNAGNYSVTVTDNSGCTSTISASVLNNSGTLIASLISLNNEECGNANGSINITVSGGTGPYTYLWTNAATTQNISSLSAGTYACTITDNVGCSVNAGPFTINNSSGTLSISGAVVTDENCNTANGAVNITVTGGTPAFIYSWSNGAITEDISAVVAGNYVVTITDQNGCVNTQSYNVNDDPGTLSISSILIADEVCNNNLGGINITVSGGTGPYNYLWNTGAVTEDISNLNNGTYWVTVTDGSGCTVNSGLLSVSNNPGNFTLVSMSVTNEICGDGTGSINVTLNGGTSPITYSWNTGAFTQDISALGAGSYAGIATDQLGCVLNYSAVVNNDAGSLTALPPSITDATCGLNNGMININIIGGTPAYTFLWNNGATTEDITNLLPGNYIVNIVDNSGCQINETYVVGNNGGNPTVVSSTITDDICNNSTGAISITVNGGTGPYTYDWNLPSSCCSYTLNMQDWNGDGWNSAAVQVYLNAVLFGTYSVTGFSNAVAIPVCPGDQIQLEYVAGGFGNWENSYSLSDGATILFQDGNPPATGISYTGTASCGGPQGQGTNTISVLSSGTYQVIVTDANGCTTTASIVVNNSGGSTYISNSVITDDFCGNGSGAIDITVSSSNFPIDYLWNTSATTEDINSLTIGTYTVTITDGMGCQFDENFTVNNFTTGLQIDNATISDAYCGDSTGAIDLTISGGTPGYTFSWSNGATTEDISGIPSGSYTATITDNTGCSTQSIYVINNLTNGLAATYSVIGELCDQQNGSIDLTITGGFDPYSILWSTSDITEDITNLDAGTYSYTITDSSGCQTSGSIVVPTNGGSINITSFTVYDDVCNQWQGWIDITVTGGSGTYNYSWSNGDISEDPFWLLAGTYTVTITDGTGCSTTQSFTVGNTNTYAIVDPAIITNSSCPTCADGSINISIDWLGNPPGNLYFWWSDGSFTEDISGLLPGTYIVQVYDDFGCVVTDTFTIISTQGIVGNTAPNILLYPNPSGGIVNLQFDILYPDLTIKIFDATGRELSYTNINTNNSTVQINLSHLSTGTYFIHLLSKDWKSIKPVVIKTDH